MTAGLKRYHGAGDLHFITCSCYQRDPLLGTRDRRNLFLTVLEQMRKRYRFALLGYVVMPEHFHLLMTEPWRDCVSTVVQAVKLGFARRVLAPRRRGDRGFRYETPAHLWQARFYDFNVWTERKRVEKLRYMHRNPVKRGLVEEPDQWLWSSFRSYAYGEFGKVRINDWELLEMKVTGSAQLQAVPGAPR
jgi:putative transposase